MTQRGGKAAEILLIEDNPGDVRLIEEAFNDSYLLNRVYTASDGQKVLHFIHREGDYEDASRPDIVLLDLFLPKVDGEDVLHEIKHQPELENVPVIILTGADEDYIKSKDLDEDADEDAVLQKSIDTEDLLTVVRDLAGFRVSIVRAEKWVICLHLTSPGPYRVFTVRVDPALVA